MKATQLLPNLAQQVQDLVQTSRTPIHATWMEGMKEREKVVEPDFH